MSRSETQTISHVGNHFAVSKSKTKAKAKAAENSVPVDDNPLEDLLEGGGVGSLSLAEQTKRKPRPKQMRKRKLKALPPRDASSFFVDYPESPSPPSLYDPGPGPCAICGGGHFFTVCAWQYECPLNADVGKYYKVVCACGSELIGRKCRRRLCSCTCGAASLKKF